LYIKFFTARGVPTVLTTNGTLLSQERLISLRQAGLTAVQIPLHSAQPTVHDTLSGAKCWRRSVEALAQARQLGLDSTAVFVATRQNISHLIGVLELLFLIGIHRVIFNRFIPSGAGILNRAALSVSDDILLEVLMEANEHAGKLGSVIELGTRLPFTQRLRTLSNIRIKSCWSGGLHRQFTVDCGGNLKYCSQSPESLGNLTDSPFLLLASRVPGMKRSLADRGVESCYCTFVELAEDSADAVR
jgi:MoaA/NifB/PqqE/SkfB family radical SAM enzyme